MTGLTIAGTNLIDSGQPVTVHLRAPLDFSARQPSGGCQCHAGLECASQVASARSKGEDASIEFVCCHMVVVIWVLSFAAVKHAYMLIIA